MPRGRNNEGETGSDPYREHQERIYDLHGILYDLRETPNPSLALVREQVAHAIELILQVLSRK